MSINNYILYNYNNSPYWFTEEVKQGYHIQRISNVIKNKDYLMGTHKILQREDSLYKGKEYVTTKLILQTAKTILNFHNTYLLGKPLTITGTEAMVNKYGWVYYKGNYNNIDFRILDKVNKYGDCGEYVYIDNGIIKSHIIKPEDFYPVYDTNNNYIACIECWTDVIDNISYYVVYYPDRVESWNNENGNFSMTDSKVNVSGLPIHYHNANEYDDCFGKSELDDIKPILDCLEDLLSKFNDGIYINSLNPLPVSIGQRIEGNISADAVGYILNMEDNADFKYVSAMLDYQSIKLLYDSLRRELLDIAHMPSIAMGNTNVANVSEVSLKLLYQLADVKAMINERYIREGLYKRFELFRKLLNKQGIEFAETDYVDVEFNYSRPVNTKDILDNLKTQYDMGAISEQSIIEKSPLTNDVMQELERLQKEKGSKKSIDNTGV